MTLAFIDGGPGWIAAVVLSVVLMVVAIAGAVRWGNLFLALELLRSGIAGEWWVSDQGAAVLVVDLSLFSPASNQSRWGQGWYVWTGLAVIAVIALAAVAGEVRRVRVGQSLAVTS